MVAPAPSNTRWLFGPAPDLLLGCGLLYVLAIAALTAFGTESTPRPSHLLPFLVLMLSLPHYGGTLLRVYERRADRRGYWFFSVYATLLVFLGFIAGLYNSVVGSWMLTLYLTWSPWHYTGQNYGIAVMFLRRRGVDVTAEVKRLLYASFILSYVLSFLAFHGSIFVLAYTLPETGAQAMPGESKIGFLPLGIPMPIGRIAFPLVAAAYIGALLACGRLLLQRASLWDLAPVATIVLTQALWFSIPLCVGYWGGTTGIGPLDARFESSDYYVMVALGHAVQYLWVTTYYARSSRRWRGYSNYLLKVLAAGVAVWTLPGFIFAPDGSGPSYGAELTLLVAAAVNIHHFILDGAIWKLRNFRIASVLIRSTRDFEDSPDPTAQRSRWLRRGVWSLAACGLAGGCFVFSQDVVGSRAMARNDYHAAAAALDRLSWFGRDSARLRHGLGEHAMNWGGFDEAIRQYRRSLAMTPNVGGYVGLGEVYALQADWRGAVRTYESALERFPDAAELLYRAGDGYVRLNEPRRAVPLLERAVALRPEHAASQTRLSLARTLLEARDRFPGSSFRHGSPTGIHE